MQQRRLNVLVKIPGDLLDQEKIYLVATPFKKRGKNSLKISDFIFALSLDLKWGSPEKVRALLREAESEGMIRMDSEMVYANFDFSGIEIPLGFKPSIEEGTIEKGIRQIMAKTGLTRKEVTAMANDRQDSLRGLVDLEAVVLLVAREQDIDVSNLAEEAYRSLIARAEEKKSSTIGS